MNIFKDIEKMLGLNRTKTVDFSQALEKAEKDIYMRAYQYHKQNQSATARSLGVARGTFITKMKEWGELK